MTKINSLDVLRVLASRNDGVDVSILLAGGLMKSSKHIWCEGKGEKARFYVLHFIDSTEEEMTRDELVQSHIGEAIEKGALILN